jgi:PAS domain S-box-containing protein
MPSSPARPSRTRLARGLRVAAAISFLAMLAAYALMLPALPRAGQLLVANISWSLAAALATACCLCAWRTAGAPVERAAWAWMAAGCACFLGGELVWSAYDVGRGTPPPYPSLADAGFLGIYAFFAVALVKLLRDHPRHRADPEVTLDVALVTFTAGALAFEFLLAPLLSTGRPWPAVLTSMLWAVGGVGVLWLMLIQMIRRPQIPLAGAGIVALGMGILCLTDVIYAERALEGTFQSGGWLDLGWDAGLLLVAVAAARAVEPLRPTPRPPGWTTASTPRLTAMILGIAGITAVAAGGALRGPSLSTALLCIVAGVILALRLGVGLRADRRYAQLLEHEVAAQTRSLMDSLAATAAAEHSLRLLMDAVPDAVVVLDREGRVLELNAPARTMVAAPDDTPPGRSIFDFLDPDTARQVEGHLDAAFAGEVRHFEVPFTRDDRTKGVSSVIYAPIREGGRVIKVLALARDVSEVRRTTAQLQQAEKLAALGQLVSGVAHEINNPAAIISGFAQTLLLDQVSEEQRDMIAMIQEEATRIGRITTNLLAFARAGGKDRSLVDVNDIVRRTFALRSYHLSTLNITVHLELDPADPRVWGNGSELQQLLLNLLINAEQALTLVTTPRVITLRTTAAEDEVGIDCADTGPGITPEIRDRIFDPFFTTKPEGIGTGLGLSICYGIARDHGGRIWVETEPGAGATFRVALPRDERIMPREGEPPRAPATPPPSLRVLLVDDEAGLRRAVTRFLTRRGMDVTAVGDGEEALAALNGQAFDVIVSDVRMPGVAGREFLDRLRRERPEAVRRLIFSTGDTYAPDTAALLEDAGVPSLVKPFDLSRLEQVVREVAARATAAAPT